MSRWKLAGDVVFTLQASGELEVECTNGVKTNVTVEEAAGLHVVRRGSYLGSAGVSTEEVTSQLRSWGMSDDVMSRLVELGLVADQEQGSTEQSRRKAPIVMVFSPRSGSNMLRWLVEAHPRISCPPPSSLVHLLIDAVNHPGSASAFRALRSPRGWSRAFFAKWLTTQLDEIAAKDNKARWCFRHWVTYRNLPHLDELLDEKPVYIFLVRHALDVVDAACKVYVPAETWQAGPNGVDINYFKRHGGSYHLAYADFWREVNERMLAFKTLHPDRVHVVRYEDLVEQPAVYLRRLFEFLGEEYHEDIPTKAFKKPPRMLLAWEGHEVTRTKEVERDHVGLWRRWDPNIIRAAAPIVNDTLAAWGYDRVAV